MRARVDARAAVDAQVRIDNGDVVDRKRLVRALVNANRASDAIVSINGNGHGGLLSLFWRRSANPQ